MNTNKYIISLATGSIGLAAGLLVAGSPQGRMSAIAGLGASVLPVALVVNLVAESRYQPKINSAEDVRNKLEIDLKKSKSGLNESLVKFESLQSQYSNLMTQHKLLESENERNKSDLANLAGVFAELNKAKAQIAELLQIKEQYESDWLQMEAGKDQIIALEVKRRVREIQKQEIQRIWAMADKFCQDFMKAIDESTELQLIFKEKADGAKEIALDVAESARKFRVEKNKQIETLLEELDYKNTRIALLQQELRGILLEPEFVDAKYNPDLDLGNAICREIYHQLKIPLRFFHAYTTEEGVTRLGFMISKGTDRQVLAERIKADSKIIADGLKLHEISSVAFSPVLEGIEISIRRSRPLPPSEEAIYRIVERSTSSCKVVRDAMNHRKGGKPTLRIMGATGEGKGIIARALLANWVKHESGEIWLSDPMDGSDEDRWEVPKVAKSASEGSKLLKVFVDEFRSRKNKSSDRKDIQVLALFDEFDKEHPKDDKELVKSIWTAIRHHNMRLILMGQSSEVGSNGWLWDEMKNCTCLFVGSGISTALKHAKDLGLSRATANQLEIQKDQIKNWLESKNQGLDSGNQYRVGLLVCGDKASFLELPAAYKEPIQNEASSIVSYPWQTQDSEGKAAQDGFKNCPTCGYKLRKSGSRLRCENPSHTKDMGVKSFSI
jgi:hypothetical protein